MPPDEELTVVVDHLAGSRRGERQTLPADHRLRFGRHPDCEVAFDPDRDLDASTRHAELRMTERGWLLVDLGSSNGTFVGGHRIIEARVATDLPLEIEFGSGGPRIRLFVGSADAAATLPAIEAPRRGRRWLWPAVGVAAIGAAVTVAAVYL